MPSGVCASRPSSRARGCEAKRPVTSPGVGRGVHVCVCVRMYLFVCAYVCVRALLLNRGTSRGAVQMLYFYLASMEVNGKLKH